MIDRIFTAVLTFALLIGGTLAIGSALFGLDHRSQTTPRVKVVQLEPVLVIGKRLVASTALAHGAEAAQPRLQ